jgi:hypothetical protein
MITLSGAHCTMSMRFVSKCVDSLLLQEADTVEAGLQMISFILCYQIDKVPNYVKLTT